MPGMTCFLVQLKFLRLNSGTSPPAKHLTLCRGSILLGVTKAQVRFAVLVWFA